MLVLGAFLYVIVTMRDSEEMEFQNLAKKNLLLAMKKTQDKVEYETDEITPAEEVTMKSQQYREVVEEQSRREKQKLNTIKSLVLLEGRTLSKTKKVDLRDL
jgi:hypothetical protein